MLFVIAVFGLHFNPNAFANRQIVKKNLEHLVSDLQRQVHFQTEKPLCNDLRSLKEDAQAIISEMKDEVDGYGLSLYSRADLKNVENYSNFICKYCEIHWNPDGVIRSADEFFIRLVIERANQLIQLITPPNQRVQNELD